MLDRITSADFANLAPQSLLLAIQGHECYPEISDIREFSPHSARVTTPFTLTLIAPHDWRFPQGLYDLIHPTLGKLSLFMVPTGPCEQGMRYEIIFN
ncbi:DUF6916 family protein [Methylocucumis oryzae]|uniref:DUF6916 domain-containing protein n=1 Tax=Methylocucumis oryzae TaxID=1632867 RepID=A0A0F3IKR4_9GAMM|nr:hypothetical protein [Methylocucumis oryzae]KJV06149.1 hypothetical protein VZ94_13180 [Methylocucumis oryzae]